MSKNILVVDDDEAVRKLFLFTLESTGYQIDTAKSEWLLAILGVEPRILEGSTYHSLCCLAPAAGIAPLRFIRFHNLPSWIRYACAY